MYAYLDENEVCTATGRFRRSQEKLVIVRKTCDVGADEDNSAVWLDWASLRSSLSNMMLGRILHPRHLSSIRDDGEGEWVKAAGIHDASLRLLSEV